MSLGLTSIWPTIPVEPLKLKHLNPRPSLNPNKPYAAKAVSFLVEADGYFESLRARFHQAWWVRGLWAVGAHLTAKPKPKPKPNTSFVPFGGRVSEDCCAQGFRGISVLGAFVDWVSGFLGMMRVL